MYVEYEKNSIQHMNASCRPPDDQLQDNGEGQTDSGQAPKLQAAISTSTDLFRHWRIEIKNI